MSRYTKRRQNLEEDESEETKTNENQTAIKNNPHHNLQIRTCHKEVVSIGQLMNSIMKSVTTSKDLDKIEQTLGWRPISICNEMDLNQVDIMCLPFLFTIDKSLTKSACAMMAIVKTRENLNAMFDIVGGQSETKTALVDMKMKIQMGLDDYTRHVHKTASNFLQLSKAFSTVYKVVECEGDCTTLVKKLQDIETEFSKQNKELEKDINKILTVIRESEKKILMLQNTKLDEIIKKLQRNVEEKKIKVSNEKKKYGELEEKLRNDKIKLKQQLSKNEYERKNTKKEMKLTEKDIEINKKSEQKYIKIIEDENKKLHNSITLEENQYDKNAMCLKQTMMNEIDLSYKEAKKELNNRMNSIMAQLADVKQDLVRLAQLERGDLNYNSNDNNHNNEKVDVLFESDVNEEIDESKQEINYFKIRELRHEEIKMLDLQLDQLDQKKAQLLQEHQNQIMELTKLFTDENETNKTKTFQKNQYEQNKWIKHFEEQKQNCVAKSAQLKKDLSNYKEIDKSLEQEKILIDEKLKSFKEDNQQLLDDAKQNYCQAISELNKEIEIYNKEMLDYSQKYGYGDIITIATSLSVLSRQCQNIGTEFQQINQGISFAREAFNGTEFQDLIALLPKENQTQPILEISNFFAKVSLIAFSLFQDPINALITNNRQKELPLTISKPIIEEVP